MNVIVYWKTGDYSDVYDVDEVSRPTSGESTLRLYRKFDGRNFEVARFERDEMRGWQIFLTSRDCEKS